MPLCVVLSGAEWLTVGLLGLLVALIAIIGWRKWRDSRVSPEEAERRRRSRLAALGKMGDGTLLEVHDTYLIYSYDVRGVTYTASQDISVLKDYLPVEAGGVAVHTLIKYDARNPADSIILAEQWSGLDMRPRR